MPYFKYKAVNLDGTVTYNSMQALSPFDLRVLLYQQDKGLIKATITLPRSWAKPLGSPRSTDFFMQLAALLSAGVYLSDAVHLLEKQTHHRMLKIILHDIAYQIKAGVSFVTALKYYKTFCNPLYLHLLNAGEQTSNLASALEQCWAFDQIIFQFNKNIKQALVTPIVTLSVFIIISSLIIVCIIPTFASMLATIQQELPPATQALIALSRFVQSWYFIAWFSGIGSAVYFILKAMNRYAKRFKDKCILHMPFFGSLYKARQNAYCFQALALLIEGSITQEQAVAMLVDAVKNEHLKAKWMIINKKLKRGISFDSAVAESGLLSESMVAMIAVGQSSDCFSFMCKQVGKHYTEFVSKRLQRMVSLVQPLIMILLGLLLTGLIIAVYLPIVQLSMALH